MSKPIRYLCLVLALLMVASTFIACGETEEPGGEVQDTATGPAVTEEETDPVEDALTALRAEVDWGGNEFGNGFCLRKIHAAVEEGPAGEFSSLRHTGAPGKGGIQKCRKHSRPAMALQFGTAVVTKTVAQRLDGGGTHRVQHQCPCRRRNGGTSALLFGLHSGGGGKQNGLFAIL